MHNTPSFGEVFRGLRRACGLTGKAVAEASGIPAARLSKIENGTFYTSPASADESVALLSALLAVGFSGGKPEPESDYFNWREVDALLRMAKGATQEQIASAHGVSRSRAGQVLSGARAKYRKKHKALRKSGALAEGAEPVL